MIQCPACQRYNIKRNGHTHNGKQNHKCRDCQRQFVLHPANKRISPETKATIDRLLLERLSLRGICRATEVSMTWLMTYIEKRYEQVPDHRNARIKPGGRIAIERYKNECDELWSFVQNKDNQQWLWVALDVDTRQVVAFLVGSREAINAKRLYLKLPKRYRTQARFYTDRLEAYHEALPRPVHEASKYEGRTNHVERFFCTMRQRVSRLVRKALSFSKKLTNHIGAIKYFIWHYNQQQPALHL